jgi:hypothetical protein
MTVVMVSTFTPRSLLSCGVAADLHPSVNDRRDQSVVHTGAGTYIPRSVRGISLNVVLKMKRVLRQK